MRPRRDPAIDGLRGIAVLSVMGCHVSKLCTKCHIGTIDFWQGACGAHLLIIISGFAMASVLYRSTSVVQFVRSRLANVYPIYAFSVALSAVLVWSYAPPMYAVTWQQLLANLTMCQSWLGSADIDGAWWLAGLLVKFYLLISIAVLLRFNGKRVELVAFGYLAFLLLWRVQLESGWGLPDAAGRLLNAKHAQLLIAGMFLWCIREFGYNFARTAGFLTCIGLEAAGSPTPWGSMLIIAIMLVCFAREYMPMLSSDILTQIGRASFANYMIHGVVSYVIIHLLMMVNVPIEAALAIAFFGVIIAAELVTQLVQPWGNFIAPIGQSRRSVEDYLTEEEREFESAVAKYAEQLVSDVDSELQRTGDKPLETVASPAQKIASST